MVLQVLGNAVRILLHIWGIWLCCFFLYLGVKVMTLVKRMPKSVLQNFDSRHKGKLTKSYVFHELIELLM